MGCSGGSPEGEAAGAEERPSEARPAPPRLLPRPEIDEVTPPAVDVTEDEKAFFVALEVPGVRPNEVKISLDGNRLIVQGEKKAEDDEQTDRMHRFERRYGSFSRTFTLPETVNTEAIEARAQDGVLTLTLPKFEKVAPRSIPVAGS